jgi:hypothetical protein
VVCPEDRLIKVFFQFITDVNKCKPWPYLDSSKTALNSDMLTAN